MYKIILSTNDNTKRNLTCVVSKAQLNRLQNSENLGGFKRFDVETYSDDEPKQRSEINFALAFLSVWVFGCSVSDLKKVI